MGRPHAAHVTTPDPNAICLPYDRIILSRSICSYGKPYAMPCPLHAPVWRNNAPWSGIALHTVMRIRFENIMLGNIMQQMLRALRTKRRKNISKPERICFDLTNTAPKPLQIGVMDIG
ncbi:hypothetical protein AA0483_0150 [Acetobacter syzygii NRIC 0483]|nr:hypothetical protein AA0483_0150 [Acetobacter syzygii NRIC 0483]